MAGLFAGEQDALFRIRNQYFYFVEIDRHRALSAWCVAAAAIFMTAMSSRHRLFLTLAIAGVVALCALVPGLLFATELALRELRLLGWLLLLLAGLGWLLVRFGRKR